MPLALPSACARWPGWADAVRYHVDGVGAVPPRQPLPAYAHVLDEHPVDRALGEAVEYTSRQGAALRAHLRRPDLAGVHDEIGELQVSDARQLRLLSFLAVRVPFYLEPDQAHGKAAHTPPATVGKRPFSWTLAVFWIQRQDSC